VYDNTVGSQSNEQLAYIAGFLDGDGSIMLQIKKRNDTARGVRFMATICFYQDTRHEKPLMWMQGMFNIGYISHRKDGMTEFRINGYRRVREILIALQPYVRFKEKQVSALIEACDILISTRFVELTDAQFQKIVDLALVVQNENYTTGKKRDKTSMLKQLGLTP
jgi:hypothetical protein